jgi:putative ABC transport system permease protein
LTHNWPRLVVALSGIGFAVVLMFMQTGFKNALFDSTVQVIKSLDADILVVGGAQYALPAKQTFSRQRIFQARGCRDVVTAFPLYIESFYGVWKPSRETLRETAEDIKPNPIRVLAFDLNDAAFRLPEVLAQVDALRQPNTALVDVKSKPKYGIPGVVDEIRRQRGAELSDRSIRLVGAFRLGTDFANDGTLIMSAANFARYFPHRAAGGDPLSVVDLGIVRLRAGSDVHAVRGRLEAMLPDDVCVWTKEEFIAREIEFWRKNTPIGFIFRAGTLMGFVVGMIICYQIIFSSIADHEAEYATLKAMGYRDRYFVGLVLKTSLYLSVFSYLPGLLLSIWLYRRLAASTGLLMILDVPRAIHVLGLTLGMCVISGCLAIRKVLATDPADLF